MSELLAKIAAKKESYKVAKKDIEAEVRAEVEKRLEAHKYELYTLMWQAWDSGEKTVDISHAYGTKDKGTIYAIKKLKPQDFTPAEFEYVAPVDTDVKIVTHFTDMGPGFKLTWPDLKEPLEVLELGGALRPLGKGENRERYLANRDHYENLIRSL